MQIDVLDQLSERARTKLGRDVLNIFAEESAGLLGPVDARYEFDRFELNPNFGPFEPYPGIIFAWGHRSTEKGFAVTAVPMLLSWATKFSAEEVRAAARAIHANWLKVQAGGAALQDRYLKGYCLVQVETLLGTFPYFDALPVIRYCRACARDGRTSAATKLMPSSTDKGVTVSLEGACDAHAATWWKNTDWDGRDLVWSRASH
jgi:hypothetical protein